MQNYEILADW